MIQTFSSKLKIFFDTMVNYLRIDAPTQKTLNAIVAQSLRPVTLGLGCLYVILAVSHVLVLSGNLRTTMIAIAATSAILLLGFWLWQRRHPVPASRAHVSGTAVLLIVALNSFVHLGIAQDPPLTTNIALLIIGTGLFFLSPRWFVGFVSITLAIGIVSIIAIGLTSEWVPFVFFLGQAALVSLLAFVIRFRSMLRMHQILMENEDQYQELKSIVEFAISNEWRYRRLAEAAHEGILIHNNGIILDANPAFANMLGYELYELVGESAYHHLVPEDVPRAKSYAQDPDPHHYYLRAIRKDGQEILLDVRAQTIVNGQSSYRMVTARDVTTERAAEQALRRQALIFENINDSVVLTDEDGLIIDCNPATERLFGHTRDQLKGKAIPDIWHSPTEATVLEIEAAIREDRRWSGEVVFVREDGRKGYCEAIVLPLRDQERNRIATIAVSHDITERKQTEQILIEAKEVAETANRAKSAFLANTSHELRTPLTAIIGYCELLEEEAADHGYKTIMSDLHKINSASRHLLSIIKDILDIAKVEAGQMSVDAEPFKLANLIVDVQLTTQAIVEGGGNRFIVESSPSVGEIISDEAKLRQILINLVGNAAKFTHDGEIRITVERATSHSGIEGYLITVSDTGIGIDQDELGNLFKPFTQGDTSTTRRYEGTGLGLAIVHRFTEMLGGTIAVESEPGMGSHFSIWLPVRIGDVLDPEVLHSA